MHGSETHNPIHQNQKGESTMEARVAAAEANIEHIQLDVREFRSDMKAANAVIGDVRIAVARIDGRIDTLRAIVDALKGEVEALRKISAGSK
jgi:hypothetical protein